VPALPVAVDEQACAERPQATQGQRLDQKLLAVERDQRAVEIPDDVVVRGGPPVRAVLYTG